MNILGISCIYHDSVACLVRDGDVLAAAQKERITRKKHDPRFPKNAIEIWGTLNNSITSHGIEYALLHI